MSDHGCFTVGRLREVLGKYPDDLIVSLRSPRTEAVFFEVREEPNHWFLCGASIPDHDFTRCIVIDDTIVRQPD